jgi:protein DGCR14
MSKQSSHNTQQSKECRLVLSEEEFTSTLSSIVQRDFFPDLPDLERQAALLEKRSQGDVAGAVAIRRAARQLADHAEALAAQEEEDEHDLEEGNMRRRARPLHQESISGFHARVTNEDDVDFDFKQKKEVKANRERLEKLFRPQDSTKTPLLKMASDEFQPESNRIAASEWNQPKVRNGFFFNPTPLRNETDQESVESTKLLANGSDTTDDATKSQLSLIMPPPAKVHKKDIISSQEKSDPILKHVLVEYVPKHVLEKKIEPSQTRFPAKIVPLPNRTLALHAESETDGSITDASTDLDAPLRTIDQERRNYQRKNERVQQSYVAMTPLIVPGAGNQSPVTTWGTVDSTPLVLSGKEQDDTEAKGSSFSLPSENERETLARKAESELTRRAKRAKTSKSKKVRGAGPLTPAAISLLEKTKRTPSRPRDAFASALRGSYTPKPRSRTNSSQRPRDSAYNATPLASQHERAPR